MLSKSSPNRRESEPRNEERLAAIEARQQRLLADLDRLNERVEEALLDFGGGRAEGTD